MTIVPLILDARRATTSPQPVTFGVPMPRGRAADPPPLALTLDGRDPLDCQTTPLARWPDGSVRWLLVDAILPAMPAGPTSAALRPADAEPSSSIFASEDAKFFHTIDTGAAGFWVARSDRPPLGWALFGSTTLLDANGCRLLLTDTGGDVHAVTHEFVGCRSNQPVRATLTSRLTPVGGPPLHLTARLCFFAGTGLVRLRLTVRNPRRARHRGGLWDRGDAGSLWFRDLSLEMKLADPQPPEVIWSVGPGETPREVYAKSSRDRFDPVVSARGASGAVTVAVPEFWQNFPRAVEVERSTLRVRLFPQHWREPFELQGGEQKTHTVWFDFAAGSSPESLSWVHDPVTVRPSPEWLAECGVLTPHCHSDGSLAELMTAAVDPRTGLAARRDVIDEYGWRNYGDLWADHEAAHYQGPPPVVSHYNNQYDVVLGGLTQYLAAGDPRWWNVADPLARHVIDIDVYHTTEDKAAYNGGLFWHTDHYKDAGSATHRAYSRKNVVRGKPYGGGPSNEHNYTTGLLLYHFLTGDEQAAETVVGLADWVIAMDDGRRTVFRWLDRGPTGLASQTRDPNYHGPGRGAANSINALLDAWQLTSQCHYLEKAEELVRRCVHPEDDVAARDLLNVEERWSYTVFLSVLARYLDLKAEADQLDMMFAYGRASLLRYAGWMLDHERPYFDRPEQLEFPTETWAAQELRKANVLRLASRHADEPIRSRMVQRGCELADRAWADLMRFPTRTTTRPLAIVMTEGVKDVIFRQSPLPPSPRPPGEFLFPPPEQFVPQRRRVMAMLRSPGLLVRSLFRSGQSAATARGASGERNE